VPTVLIIDDDPLIRRAYGRLLSAGGWSVTSTGSPTTAAALYAQADVVLSDWDMPDGGGARVLRDSPVPVVVHSGSYAGGHRFAVAKPARIGDVLAELSRALESARAHDRDVSPETAAAP
jgi:CheY-like chemotaxis protein